MKIELTGEEAEQHFLDALCNGMSELAYSGLSLDYSSDAYKVARAKLVGPCREDVWVQILRDGGELTLVDSEGDGDYTRSIRLTDVHNNISLTPISHLVDMINGNDDSTTAFAIIQAVFYKEVVFG